jgi:hypothetical protein
MSTQAAKVVDSTHSYGRLSYSAKDEDFIVRQVVIIEDDLRNLIIKILCSSSVAGYNHATHDVYGGGLGVGIPYEPISALVESLARVDGAVSANSCIILLDRPTTFKDLFNADLILRQAFIHWFNGSLRAAKWAVPRASLAIASLTEDNKAGSIGDVQRIVSERTDRYMRNSIKIEYNKIAGEDKYESSFHFIDVASQQNYGFERSVTIKARNSYGDYATTGDSVKSIAPGMLSVLPMFSRPRFECIRTINFTLYEALYVGAVVTVTDNFMRDPSTGLRGVTDRSAIVTRLRYDFGGWELGGDSPREMFGEVNLLLTEAVDGKPMCPSAVVDIAHSGGVYTLGFGAPSSIKTLPKEFAASGETYDFAAFSVGDRISIVEINPDVPASALQFDCTITVIASLYYFTVDIDLAAAGFVAGREYKIIPQAYANVITAQKNAYSYMADGTSTINAARDAYTFGEDDDQRYSLALAVGTSYVTGGKIAELNATDAEGLPYDVATQVEMLRAVEHLVDGRLAVISSCLRPSATANGIYIIPAYVGGGLTTGRISRNLRVGSESTSSLSVLRSMIVSESPPRMTESGVSVNVDKTVFRGKFDRTDVVSAISGDFGYSMDYATERGSGDGMVWITLMGKTEASKGGLLFYGVKEFRIAERV